MSCDDINFYFFKWIPPPFTVSYLVDFSVENVDILNSKYEWVVSLLLKCLY